MSWPASRRNWVLACAICAVGTGPLSAQQATEKQSSDRYAATAELYRKSAAKNAPERRDCFLGWAAYYDSLAAAVRDGIALPPEPDLDPLCPAPGFAPLLPGESDTPAAGPLPVQTARSAAVQPAAALVPTDTPMPVEAEPEAPAETAPPALPAQSPAAALFDGLRYDMSKSAAGSAEVTPVVRRRIDALQLIMEDISAAPANGRAAYLEEFISSSAPVASDPADNPYKFGIVTLRTAAFLELNRPQGGREASAQLLAMGAASNEDPSVRRLMAMLERKGWLVQDTGLWTPAAASVAGSPAAAATASLAGSVWSGALILRDRNRKEVARYGIDLQFTENGSGSAIYRHFTPAFTWTQVGARAVVKTQLAADCTLSMDITMDGGTQRGAASWTGTVNPGGNCFQSAGGAKTFMPSEFTATRVATATALH